MRRAEHFSIGQLARETGSDRETIRYYERVGLMPAPSRTAGGHRIYRFDHMKRLRFILRSRGLGFSVKEVRSMLQLVDQGEYQCEDVKVIAAEHLLNVRAKLKALKKLEKTLDRLTAKCTSEQAVGCPFITALYSPSSAR